MSGTMVSPHLGRSTRRAKAQTAALRAQGLPCRRCGQPIDYTLQWPHPQAFTKGHIVSKRDRPDLAEDPANLAAEHALCNQQAGADSTPIQLGQPSEAW